MMKQVMKCSLAVLVLTLTASSTAHAIQSVPEIDPSMGVAGMALLAGTVTVIRGLRRR